MDDLFGDLPAAKNTPAHLVNTSSNNTVATSTKNDVSAKQSAPPAPSKTTEEPKSKSLVSSLGTAGTSMAFVPQALRKKKRVSQVPNQSEKKQRIESTAQVVVANQVQTSSTNVISEQKMQGSDTLSVPIIDSIIDIPKQSILHDNTTQEPSDTDEPEPYLENEPPSLRALHEAAKQDPHPYNPHTPNDYLAYRERKKTEAIKQDMQAAALAKIQAHEALRAKIQEERAKIEAEGDIEKIVASRGGGMGRGRGRGLSNLPAWLIQKQQQEEKSATGGNINNAACVEKEEGKFDNPRENDGCNNAISLLNMVAPGEIDPELKEERGGGS
jgi:hypothetical protein